MHDVEDQGIFAIAESADPGPKIDVDKENAVRQPQPVNVRHGVSIAPRTYTSREEPTVREALTVATRFRRGCPLTESPRVGARTMARSTALFAFSLSPTAR